MKNTNESDLDRVLLGQEYPPDLKMEKPEILSELNQLYLDLNNPSTASDKVSAKWNRRGSRGYVLEICTPDETPNITLGQIEEILTQTQDRINALAQEWALNRIPLIEQEISRLETELKAIL